MHRFADDVIIFMVPSMMVPLLQKKNGDSSKVPLSIVSSMATVLES